MPLQTRLNILHEISEIMSSSLELNWVFDRVMRVLASQLGIETGYLVILDDMGGQLRIRAAHGLSQEEVDRGIYSVGEGVIGQVYQSGQAHVLADVRQDPVYLDRTGRRKNREEAVSFICLPITCEGKTIGVFSADKVFPDHETLEQDHQLMEIITAMISHTLRISNMVMREKEELLSTMDELREALSDQHSFPNMIGTSAAMAEVFETVHQVAKTRATILLMGETGTGKEMMAKAIHFNSDRRDEPFIRVNCGALSGSLLESELFGHVKGAFTGAIRDKMGRFEAANGGTLFLDEIATLEMGLQVKLLRVLQEREFERVGDYHTIQTDVRIVAAASVDLEKEVEEKRFRDDLFYRLNVVSIHLPPLRERREDIPPLIDYFLDRYNKENNRNLKYISRDILNMLLRYSWPGNVRELENAIERGVVMSQDENFTEDLLPLSIRAQVESTRPSVLADSPDDIAGKLARQTMEERDLGGGSVAIWAGVMDRIERSLIAEALKRCDGVKIRAADYLGINRNTLNKKYNDLGLGEDKVSQAPINSAT